MESPKFNLNRFKNSSPTKRKLKNDLDSSDSFSNAPNLLTNNTPEYLKPRPLSKFSNKTEFTSSVQEFLKQSSEIQDEIRKLSEICQQVSPKFNKDSGPNEPIDWEKLNDLLKNLGFKPVDVADDKVDPDSLLETFAELVYDYSSQIGILEQTKNEIQKLEDEIDQANIRNKALEKKIEKLKSRKNIEIEVKELEKISKNMENKFKKMKETLKQKEGVIRDLKMGLESPKKNFTDAVDSDYKEIFRIFMGKEFREKSKTDSKILALIEKYEKHTNFNELQVILDELEVHTSNEALLSISRLKNGQGNHENIEIFIQELYCKLFSKNFSSNYYGKYEETFDEILSKVSELTQTLFNFEEFKSGLEAVLQCKRNTGIKDIMEKVKTIAHFRKLFYLDDHENEVRAIEEIFLFVHEMKKFLQHARTVLRKDSISLNSLLEEIAQCLVRNYE